MSTLSILCLNRKNLSPPGLSLSFSDLKLTGTVLNEFEALTNLDNTPIIFTYYSEKGLSISTIQYTHFRCSSRYLRSARARWGRCDQSTSTVSLSSALASSCWCATLVLASKISELMIVLAACEPPRRASILSLPLSGVLVVFSVRDEGLDNPSGDIILVLGKAETELKVKLFMKNTGGPCLRCLSCV